MERGEIRISRIYKVILIFASIILLSLIMAGCTEEGIKSQGLYKIEIAKSEQYEINVDKDEFREGESVLITVENIAQGYSVDKFYYLIDGDESKNYITNPFIMPDSDITLYAQTSDNEQEKFTINDLSLGDIDIRDLKMPFCAVAVDLITSKEIVFTKGNLPKIIAASCAVPGVFVPVEYEGMHLSDGGLQNNIPSDVPRFFGCDYVIAIDVNSTRGEGTDSLKIIDVLSATIRIMSKSNSINGYINADFVIKPSMKKYKSTKVDEAEAMFAEGYMATIDAIPKILEIISKKPNKAQKRRFAVTTQNKPVII